MGNTYQNECNVADSLKHAQGWELQAHCANSLIYSPLCTCLLFCNPFHSNLFSTLWREKNRSGAGQFVFRNCLFASPHLFKQCFSVWGRGGNQAISLGTFSCAWPGLLLFFPPSLLSLQCLLYHKEEKKRKASQTQVKIYWL